MYQENRHTVRMIPPFSRKGWRIFIRVKTTNEPAYTRNIRTISDYKQALHFARAVAKHEQLELIVQDEFGRVTLRENYG
jgi:hypothetical protein